jgi:CheY-like chemotaxis protein
MNTYKVKITETLERVITTKANNEEEAIEYVKQEYDEDHIILDADDFAGVDFEIVPYSKNYICLYDDGAIQTFEIKIVATSEQSAKQKLEKYLNSIGINPVIPCRMHIIDEESLEVIE